MRFSSVTSLLALLTNAALAVPVTNWVTTNGDAGFSAGSELTSSPVTTDSDAETIVGSFPAVTLAIGESLTLTGSVTITGNTGTLPSNQFRWGLFDSPGIPTSGVGNNYVGVIAVAPATGSGILATTDGSTTNPFSSTASTTIASAADPENDAPQFDSSLSFSLTISRIDATQLTASATLSNSTNLSIQWPTTSALASPSSFTYDAVGFLLGGTLNASSAAFSNIDVAVTTDPKNPNSQYNQRVLGIDFNRNDTLGSPSQALCRTISGSATQAQNLSSYSKKFGNLNVTVTQPDAAAFEFRGANSDSSRTIPGGDVSRSFLVADFIATRRGTISITLGNLPAGTYLWKSYHLDTFTGANLGFAQGANATTANTIEARIAGNLHASVNPTALGSSGLNTTFINDNQIPTLTFAFTHDGSEPAIIELSANATNGSDSFLLLNGFEIFTAAPQEQ